jgi:hypothetical protein
MHFVDMLYSEEIWIVQGEKTGEEIDLPGVIPAKAGIHCADGGPSTPLDFRAIEQWIPAFAGMTGRVRDSGSRRSRVRQPGAGSSR